MLIKLLFYIISRMVGWKFELKIPLPKSYVLIGVPHTSNWDAFPGIATAYLGGPNAKIAIKNELMFFPLKYILNYMGFVGVDRSSHAAHFSEQMIAKFKQNPNFILMLAPEGTRKLVKQWKTGFYFIAKGANVPIVIAKVKRNQMIIEINKIIYPTELEKDMKEIMDYCRDAVGLRPENFQLDERYDH